MLLLQGNQNGKNNRVGFQKTWSTANFHSFTEQFPAEFFNHFSFNNLTFQMCRNSKRSAWRNSNLPTVFHRLDNWITFSLDCWRKSSCNFYIFVYFADCGRWKSDGCREEDESSVLGRRDRVRIHEVSQTTTTASGLLLLEKWQTQCWTRCCCCCRTASNLEPSDIERMAAVSDSAGPGRGCLHQLVGWRFRPRRPECHHRQPRHHRPDGRHLGFPLQRFLGHFTARSD